MDDLEARLARLEDERGILRTLHMYCQAIDYGDEDAWVDCFTEDAVYDVRYRINGTAALFRGRHELRAFVSDHTRAPELWHKHNVLEPLIDVTGDTASCSSYFVTFVDFEERPALRVFGRYLDRLVRDTDGRWRFAERIVDVEARRAGLPDVYPRPAAAGLRATGP